jgi:hypothetical protein
LDEDEEHDREAMHMRRMVLGRRRSMRRKWRC